MGGNLARFCNRGDLIRAAKDSMSLARALCMAGGLAGKGCAVPAAGAGRNRAHIAVNARCSLRDVSR